jgi:hypothetical protein
MCGDVAGQLPAACGVRDRRTDQAGTDQRNLLENWSRAHEPANS